MNNAILACARTLWEFRFTYDLFKKNISKPFFLGIFHNEKTLKPLILASRRCLTLVIPSVSYADQRGMLLMLAAKAVVTAQASKTSERHSTVLRFKQTIKQLLQVNENIGSEIFITK